MRSVPLLVLLAACGGGGDDTISLAFLSPAEGAELTRESLDDVGALVAAVPVEVALDGPAARVALSIGTTELADFDAAGLAVAHVGAPGPATLIATAFDEAGTAVATAQVNVTIVEPVVANCQGWLDLYGVPYTAGPTRPGVDDPVTSMMPINGITYRSGGSARTTLFGDCTLIKSLAEAAPILRKRQIVQVTDLGVYNYRCIGGSGTPPDNCPNGVSQHAYGNAIDIASVEQGDGTSYSVLTDWVIDPTAEKTCEAGTEPGKDAFLHELICALKTNMVWNIVLTPNYNADHRNHFHVDLKEGSDFIRRGLPH